MSMTNDFQATAALSTPQLVAYIITRHHNYLRRTLPFLEALATRVLRAHGTHEPRLTEVERCVRELSRVLSIHLADEERDVFPRLIEGSMPTQEVSRLFSEMIDEHAQITNLLQRVRDACDAFQAPTWACASYRTLFSELERLESDTFTHLQLEDQVLRPRFTH